ncbi:hypothetical protein E4U59_005710 [Claviceps monticola]|nr:hypothetical protein E4U59_005710 [Claviceps monticola]
MDMKRQSTSETIASCNDSKINQNDKDDKTGPESSVDMELTRQRIYQLHHHCSPCQPTTWLNGTNTIDVTAESRTRLIASVRQILNQGFILLLLGDAVFDVASGLDKISGDALMNILAMSLDAVQRCIFVTGVAGIYTRDLEIFDDATLVRQLRCISTDTDQGACDEPDATGATNSKWQWVQRIMRDAPHVREVVICQVSEADRALAFAFHAKDKNVTPSQDSSRVQAGLVGS